MNILAVTIGGAIGSLLRYLLGLTLAKAFQNACIPVSMIVVNALGSFGLGAFIAIEQLASNSFIYATIAIGFFWRFYNVLYVQCRSTRFILTKTIRSHDCLRIALGLVKHRFFLYSVTRF